MPLISPIVRVETVEFSGDESQPQSLESRTHSKRSSGGKRSNLHLSPHFPEDEDDESSDEDVPTAQIRPLQRNEYDGSWIGGDGLRHGGLDPNTRKEMRNLYVPSLEEQEMRRVLDEKKAEVVDWLDRSDVGSEAGDPNPLSPKASRRRIIGRRRAKSTNDTPSNHGLGATLFPPRLDDGIPGPGLYLDVPSELDDAEDFEYTESEDEEPESPAAEIASIKDEIGFQIADRPPSQVMKPWGDAPLNLQSEETIPYQPPTSNAAMMRFRERARDIESASLAATIGSRRMSESDIGSVYAASGVLISKPVLIVNDKYKNKDKRDRRSGFFDNILPKRSNSNILKRKNSAAEKSTPKEPGSPAAKEPEKLSTPKRIGSWGRPKSPKLETSLGSGKNELAPTSTASHSSIPWRSARNAIRRNRSKSDLGKSPGLAELMTQHGGPPLVTLASPANEVGRGVRRSSTQPRAKADDDDSDNEGDLGQDSIFMDLAVRSDPINPTFIGFKEHARKLNPRLAEYLLERIAIEQVKRYKRLLDFKVKHHQAIQKGSCSAGSFCFALGGQSKLLPPRASNKDTETPFVGFQIMEPGMTEENLEVTSEGTIIPAQFPSGVPIPPVKRLPAEFECPLCFKVKKFNKPSDWTKHVHEDVQPFTCTFPNCSEPKSFKRKADWVRHENERHRKLESWTCNIGECAHTCYRKDNFVQHLVREHKLPEPKVRSGRNGGSGSRSPAGTEINGNWPGGDDSVEAIWALVEKCRHDTEKLPKEEACRFCGNICSTWKKLTVHLAKHMEQISMPILPLVEAKEVNDNTIISPIDGPEPRLTALHLPGRGTLTPNPTNTATVQSDLPTFLYDEPGAIQYDEPLTSLSLDPSTYSNPMSRSASSSNFQIMHTYPPPQIINTYRGSASPLQQATNFQFTASPSPGNYSTYPGLQVPRGGQSSVGDMSELTLSPPDDFSVYDASTPGGPSAQPMFSPAVKDEGYPEDLGGISALTSSAGFFGQANAGTGSIGAMPSQQQQQQQQQQQSQMPFGAANQGFGQGQHSPYLSPQPGYGYQG